MMMLDFSDSRKFTIESQEGGVQEIQGSGVEQSEVRVNFQRQMKNLAETVKGSMALQKEGAAKPIVIDQMATNNSNSQQQQHVYQQSHLTASLDDEFEKGSIVAPSSQRNKYEMPMKMSDQQQYLINDGIEENVNSSSANKKYRKMFSPQNLSNSPYFQSSKFSMQAAKNQVNAASATSMMISNSNNSTNVFKRDRSSSNNAKRPPMPTSASLVSYNNQTCPTTNSPHHHSTLLTGQPQQQQSQSRMSHGNTMTSQQQYSQGSGGSNVLQQKQLYAQQFQQPMSQQNFQQQYQQNSSAVSLSEVSVLPINNGNASVIAEMHYQKGMTDIKQDLQRKIVSYQSILKKTYAQAEKEKQAKKRNAVGKQSSKDNASHREKTPNQSKRKAGIPSAAALEQRCQPSKVVSSNAATSRVDSKKRTTSKDKVESLDQLKSAYFAKMQSLTKKLDNDRVVSGTSNLSHHRREESQSRSKSPMQPWKNMPRQMPSSMKDVYAPTTASIPINRKSISRGKNGGNQNPSIGSKQVSIKQGLKTTMTANSGQYFPNTGGIPGKNTVNNKNSKAYAKKRNSVYADSDSSDDIVRGGDMRRGSAPMINEKANVEIGKSQQQTAGHRRRQQQANQNTYVLTSSDSSNYSDSDSDDSIDENQKADVYQPASHLRKAINGQQNSRIAPSTTKNIARQQVNQVAAARLNHTRIKSTGKRETSQTNNKRTHSKGSSNTRAKHGIQSVQNRTAITGIVDKKGTKHATSTTSAKDVNQTQIHNGYQGINFFNNSGSDKQTSLIQNGNSNQTYGSSSSQAKLASQNRTVQQISNKSLSGNHGTNVAQKKDHSRQLVQGGFASPQQEQSRVSSSKHSQLHHHNTIDQHQPPQGRNFHPQGLSQNSLIQQHQMAVGNTRSSGNLINNQQMIPSSAQHQSHSSMGNGFQPIYNLRSQAQINLLENHRLTESNLSNTSAFERVINPVNDLNYPPRKGSDHLKPGGVSTRTGGYTEARNRAMVNNYV